MDGRRISLILYLGSLWITGAGAAVGEPRNAGHPPAALFVYDASGSMLRKVEGKPKDEVARTVMNQVLRTLDPKVRVGLLTFGHRRKGDCKDLEVVAPIGSDRAAVAKTVNAIQPKGETPLAEAVKLAVGQLKDYEGEASVVVVSDGKDECGGDPCAAAREAIASGVHVRFHVVGFDVARDEAQQLQCVAREGNGKYFSASNASQLARALQEVEREVGPKPTPKEGKAGSNCHPPKRGSTGPIACECDAEATKQGSVWGTDLYTDDSSVCRAAVHAGVIKETGGKVTVYPYGGQDLYTGGERNGIYSSDYGAWPASFGFKEGLRPHTGGCPETLSGYSDKKPLSCDCTAKAAAKGGVWGSDVYTSDSSICRAAVHAGSIKPEGGKVTVYPMPGRGSYEGEERNGVASSDYGAYGKSFAFRTDVASQTVVRCLSENLAEGKPLTCTCRSVNVRGTVWGTDVYTRDSSICRAAVHAGVIPASGGTLTVKATAGRDSYSGTERNGVTSNSFGTYDASFTFQK